MSDTSEGPPLVDREWLATVRSELRDWSGVLVCLDFDGTLAPIVDEPDRATIRPDIAARLRVLADHPGIVTAVVSGRSLADLRDRVGIDGLHYAGNHGLEWDDGDGRQVESAGRAAREAIGTAVESLRDELDGVPGCTVENKGLTATVHVRQTPDVAVPAVTETVERVASDGEGVRVTRGREILELRPDVPAGKDLAVERLHARYPNALPLFVGDDLTDEDGFRAVADDGYGVLVGRRADSAASVRVPNIDGTALLLGWLLQTCDRASAVVPDDEETPSPG